MTEQTLPPLLSHDWAAGVREGMPVLLCQRGGCRMAWWPDRREPRSTCTGERAPGRMRGLS